MNHECNHNNDSFGNATFGGVQFLVTYTKVYHHCSYKMVKITICHYKSLLVMDFECNQNNYTFGDATFSDVQFLVMKALLTITNELMVTFFAPHQCPFLL